MHMLLHQTPLLFSPFLWPEWTSAHQCINPDGWCTDGFHFFIPGLTLNSPLPHPRPSVTYQTAHISMSSTDAIPIYHVIISPHPSTFLPTSHWSRYLPNPTYLSSCLSSWPHNYNEDIARNTELFTQAILKVMISFLVNTHMTILHKSKKSRMYAIFSSEYFVNSLDWNIVF
jgi:hypothetical protein